MKYEFKSKDLYHLYWQMGFSQTISGARQFFFRKKNEGSFTPPQLPSDKGEWRFTNDQLKEIIKAFGPGGKGEWHFKN